VHTAAARAHRSPVVHMAGGVHEQARVCTGRVPVPQVRRPGLAARL